MNRQPAAAEDKLSTPPRELCANPTPAKPLPGLIKYGTHLEVFGSEPVIPDAVPGQPDQFALYRDFVFTEDRRNGSLAAESASADLVAWLTASEEAGVPGSETEAGGSGLPPLYYLEDEETDGVPASESEAGGSGLAAHAPFVSGVDDDSDKENWCPDTEME